MIGLEVRQVKIRAHLIVAGNVQGVFYRAETASRARRLGVNGWVRNLPDGRVEAVFEGEEVTVEKMIDFCRRGPPNAQVFSIDVIRERWRGEFGGFSVKY